MTQTSLHPSIVSLISLAASIAANHPGQGLCQIDKLRELGIGENQIDLAIEIARHIRDETAQKLDAKFDAAYVANIATTPSAAKPFNLPVVEACCTPTASGKSCC